MSHLPISTGSESGSPENPTLAPRTVENVEPHPPVSGNLGPGDFGPDDLLTVLRGAVADGKTSSEALLRAIADAARTLTGASAVAIGLRTHGVVVCRARSGDMAPGLGSPLNVDSGISGECFRTAKVLRCEDAQSDSRVDPEVCRVLGIRSIVAVPLRSGVETTGILEAFSENREAFSDDQVVLLEDLGKITETAYRQQSVETSLSLIPASPMPAGPVSAALSLAETTLASPEASQLPILPIPVVPGNQREQISLGVFEEHPPHRRSYWVLSGAVAMLLLAGAVVWWTWHEPLAENSTSQATAQASAATEKAEPVALRVLPLKPSATVANQPAERSSTKAPLQNAAKIEVSEEAKASPPGKGAVNEIKLPVVSGTSVRSAPVGAAVDPPTVVVANTDGGGEISGLASEPANLPTLEAKVSQGVTAPNLIRKVEPVYPREALTQRLGGTVTLTASIAEDGTVREIKVLSGQPLLAEAAVAAVRQWRYSPCLLNGKPVSVEKPITIIFKTP